MCEIRYKDIDGYEGLYRIYQNGEIYSYRMERNLKHSIDKSGYHRVSLSKNGKSKGFMVHRLVGFAFMSDSYNDGDEINHEDADKGNNWDWNLTWDTHQYNMNHVSENMLNPLARELCVIDDKDKVLKVYKSLLTCESEYDTNFSMIYHSCNGNVNMANGVKFRYYDKDENTFLKTRFDTGEVKSKGKYGKLIKCVETGYVTDSQQKMADKLKVNQCSISEVLRGKKDSVKGKHIIYVNEI